MITKFKSFITCTIILILSLTFIPCTCVASDTDLIDDLISLEDLPPVESYYEQCKYYGYCYENYKEIYFKLYHSRFYEELKENLKNLDEVESWESLNYQRLLDNFKKTFNAFFDFDPLFTKLGVTAFYFYVVLETNAAECPDFLKQLARLLNLNGIGDSIIAGIHEELFSDEKFISQF